MADLWGYEHLLNKPIIQNRSHVVDFMGSAMKEAGGAFTRYQALKAAEAEKAAGRQHEKDMFGLQNDAQNERFGKEMDLKGQQFGLENERYQSGQRAEAMKRNLAPVEATRKELDIPEAWELDQVRGKYDAALASPSIGAEGRVPYADAPGPWREGYEPNVSTSEFQTYMAPEIEAGRKAYLQRTAGEKLKQTYASHPRQPSGGSNSDPVQLKLLSDLQAAQGKVAEARNLKVTDALVLQLASSMGVSPEQYVQQRANDAQARFNAAQGAWVDYSAGRGIYGAGAPAPKPQGQPVFQPQPIQPQGQPSPEMLAEAKAFLAANKGNPNVREMALAKYPWLASQTP